MKMTPRIVIFGALLIFWPSAFIGVFLPALTMDEQPSDEWVPWDEKVRQGHDLYSRNGCSYCHSQQVRTYDWDLGAERITQRGDYYGQQPAIVGTERTGPDLMEAGGEHNNDWHRAHFANPRTTRPLSLMPSWEFLGEGDIELLTAYVQARMGKGAQLRMQRQQHWGKEAQEAYLSGPDRNIQWLHSQVPRVWREMPNPYPALDVSLARGRLTYQQFCINCHGPMGDGGGSATKYFKDSPPPLNFTTLRRRLVVVERDGKTYHYIGGLFYYQIMNGITGTAMPYFKKELESDKIWDVSNYVAVTFVGYTDAGLPPTGIDASYEPPWTNPFKPPQSVGPSTLPGDDPAMREK